MRIPIERIPVKVYPDSGRVIARFFFNGDERGKQIIERVMQLNEEEVFTTVSSLLQQFSRRHRNVTKLFYRHCDKVKYLFDELDIEYEAVSDFRKLLIGSYFTNEYSIESAAFFNPSIIEDPDQSDLEEGEKRLIMSFRAVGEGHISSIAFRRVLIDKNNNINVLPAGNYVDEPEVVYNSKYDKELFFSNAEAALIDKEVLRNIGDQLEESFEYPHLQKAVNSSRAQAMAPGIEQDNPYDKVLWLSDSYYKITFSLDTDISDRVIFPFSEMERKGIEDARFVKFTEDNGKVIYYATYTAYDGSIIFPKLLQTTDFYNFHIRPLFGKGAQNKNLALFPRRINGKYAMISRIDGWNNYIMFSDNIQVWEDPVKLQSPAQPWEFVQIGNCGSPLETEKGWLVITHGVGPMRRYCLGASLLKLDDPSVEIGRLKEPLLVPTEDERAGYVPNVVYSCGSIINNGKLIIPYGLSDYSSSFASVDLNTLLDRLISDGV